MITAANSTRLRSILYPSDSQTFSAPEPYNNIFSRSPKKYLILIFV